MRPAIYGAYTELYAGLSLDVTASHNGTYSKSELHESTCLIYINKKT